MVKQDSRYPRFVNCVSAGTTEIVVGYRFGVGLPVPVRICRGAVSADTLIGPVRVVFDSFTPYPHVPAPPLP